ncbi:MAG: hypothetical protein K2X34_01550 [Hyphomonadaceae bacterium]|nr:hypothetical protein [Hyphomonadaceae bacterium]
MQRPCCTSGETLVGDRGLAAFGELEPSTPVQRQRQQLSEYADRRISRYYAR